jgi:hypothetical protein
VIQEETLWRRFLVLWTWNSHVSQLKLVWWVFQHWYLVYDKKKCFYQLWWVGMHIVMRQNLLVCPKIWPFFYKCAAVNITELEDRMLDYVIVLEEQIYNEHFLWYQKRSWAWFMTFNFTFDLGRLWTFPLGTSVFFFVGHTRIPYLVLLLAIFFPQKIWFFRQSWWKLWKTFFCPSLYADHIFFSTILAQTFFTFRCFIQISLTVSSFMFSSAVFQIVSDSFSPLQ